MRRLRLIAPHGPAFAPERIYGFPILSDFCGCSNLYALPFMLGVKPHLALHHASTEISLRRRTLAGRFARISAASIG